MGSIVRIGRGGIRGGSVCRRSRILGLGVRIIRMLGICCLFNLWVIMPFPIPTPPTISS